MMKKTISGICAVLLTLTAVSCQKSNVDQALDAQTNLVGTMQKINDRDSADKYANEVAELTDQFIKLLDTVDQNKDEEKKLKDHPKYMENREKLEDLGNKLHVGKYYESEKLRNALRRR